MQPVPCFYWTVLAQHMSSPSWDTADSMRAESCFRQCLLHAVTPPSLTAQGLHVLIHTLDLQFSGLHSSSTWAPLRFLGYRKISGSGMRAIKAGLLLKMNGLHGWDKSRCPGHKTEGGPQSGCAGADCRNLTYPLPAAGQVGLQYGPFSRSCVATEVHHSIPNIFCIVLIAPISWGKTPFSTHQTGLFPSLAAHLAPKKPSLGPVLFSGESGPPPPGPPLGPSGDRLH